MYKKGALELEIDDEADIGRGLDAHFVNLHDFDSRKKRLHHIKLRGSGTLSERKIVTFGRRSEGSLRAILSISRVVRKKVVFSVGGKAGGDPSGCGLSN